MTLTAPFLTLCTALLIPGLIGKVKARMSGRKMPSLFQPLYDVIRLIRKGSVYSYTTSIIFRVAPSIYLASILCALLFMPMGVKSGILSFEYDFVYFAYLLGIGKFMMILAAMDTGSGFEGMGANREALYSMLIEPAFFILFASLALLTGQTSFYKICSLIYAHGSLISLIALLSSYLLFQIAMIENSRLLIDDPKTHLELTMVHEVMVLDHSGFDLALIHIASWLKFAIYSGFIANILMFPLCRNGLEIVLFLGVSIVFAIMVGLMESFQARNKMSSNPPWILLCSSIALVIFLSSIFVTSQ